MKVGFRIIKFRLLMAAIWALALIGSTRSAPLTVTSLNDSGPGSLRQAILDASPEDTSNFAAAGIVTLTNGGLQIDSDLTITGPGAANLTISGNHASRIFNISAGNIASSGLTIANSSGGGLLNQGVSRRAPFSIPSEVWRSTGGSIAGFTMPERPL